jgi:hypothetical protein
MQKPLSAIHRSDGFVVSSRNQGASRVPFVVERFAQPLIVVYPRFYVAVNSTT